MCVSFQQMRELARQTGRLCSCFYCHQDVTERPHAHVSRFAIDPNCDAYNCPDWVVVCAVCMPATNRPKVYPCPNDPKACFTVDQFFSRAEQPKAAQTQQPEPAPERILRRPMQLGFANIVPTAPRKRR